MENQCNWVLAFGCDKQTCCFHRHLNMIFVFIFVSVVVVSVIVLLQQIFWDFPRRRKRFYERPSTERDFQREHDVVEGRFPTLARVIDEEEEKEKKAGLDPKRKRELDPASGLPSSERLSQKSGTPSSQKAAPSSSKGQQPTQSPKVSSQIGLVQGKSGKDAPLPSKVTVGPKIGSGKAPPLKSAFKAEIGASIKS